MKSDMGAIVRVMQLPDSGLEIRDRMWLKITIANAVIGESSLPAMGVGPRSFFNPMGLPRALCWPDSGGCVARG